MVIGKIETYRKFDGYTLQFAWQYRGNVHLRFGASGCCKFLSWFWYHPHMTDYSQHKATIVTILHLQALQLNFVKEEMKIAENYWKTIKS